MDIGKRYRCHPVTFETDGDLDGAMCETVEPVPCRGRGPHTRPAPCGGPRRPVRFSGPLRAAGAAAGLVALCWLIDYAVMPAVLWTVLVLADGIRVAMGWGSML